MRMNHFNVNQNELQFTSFQIYVNSYLLLFFSFNSSLIEAFSSNWILFTLKKNFDTKKNLGEETKRKIQIDCDLKLLIRAWNEILKLEKKI